MQNDLIQAIQRKGLQAPLKSYLWRVELPDLRLDGFTSQDVLEVSSRILTCNIPFVTIETDKAIHGNTFWYFAKSADIGNISMDVLEYEDGLTFRYFDAWRQLVTNINGTFNPPVTYKRNISFYRLDGMKQDVVKDVYIGYFVTGVSDSSNDYESNNVVRYTINFTGDDVEHYNMNLVNPIDQNDFQESINKAKSLKQSITEFLF